MKIELEMIRKHHGDYTVKAIIRLNKAGKLNKLGDVLELVK